MYLIPTLSTQEEVLMVLNKIESSGEPGAETAVLARDVSHRFFNVPGTSHVPCPVPLCPIMSHYSKNLL